MSPEIQEAEIETPKQTTRRELIALLNAALAAIKEIKEGNYNKNDCVVGEGIVLEQEQPQKQSSNVQQNHPKKPRKPTTKQTLRRKGRSALQTQRNRKVHNYQETLIPIRIERTWIESEVTGESGYSGKEYTYTETKYY